MLYLAVLLTVLGKAALVSEYVLLIPFNPHFTDMILSLWTKYTVAGERASFCMNHLLCFPDIFTSAIPGSFIFTMLFLPLYAIVAPAIGFSTEYYGLVPRLWTDAVFYFVLLLVPIVCLARDFAWK